MKRKKGNADRLTAGAWWSRNRWSCVILAAALVLFIVVRMAAVTFEQPQPRGDEYAEYETGVVTDILSDSTEADTVADGGYRGEQLLLAQVRSGQYKGETMQVYNYVGPLYGQPLKVGQRAVLLISTYSDGSHTATVYEYDRAVGLAVTVGLFLLATVLVGGKVGAKSLVALAVTLVCLFWILIPLLMKGAPTLLTVFLVYMAHVADMNGGAVGASMVSVAVSKVTPDWITLFFKGILCNIFVCLAVWIGFGGRTIVDKVVGILLPISAFVACGFEHCVANMFFLPMGLLAKTSGFAAIDASALDLGSIFYNISAATLGNIVGGAVFVGLAYWFVYRTKAN